MPGDSLKVLSFNLYNHHDGPAAFEHRLQAIASVIAGVNPDVLCVQEAPSAAFLRALWAFMYERWRGDQERRPIMAGDLRGPRMSTTRMEREDGWSEHLAIIHARTDRVSQVLTSPTGENIGLAVYLPAQRLTVANVHLNAHDPERRNAQAAALLEQLPADGALLLCGDMNAVEGDETMAKLSTGLLHLAPQDGSVTFPTGLRTDAGERQPAAVDHILGRGVTVAGSGVAGWEPVDGVWASDHAGVWAEVE